jgi:hypothetical protein
MTIQMCLSLCFCVILLELAHKALEFFPMLICDLKGLICDSLLILCCYDGKKGMCLLMLRRDALCQGRARDPSKNKCPSIDYARTWPKT